MRVLFVISSLGPGGAERIMAGLANAFAEAGDEVALLTLSGKEEDHYELHPSVTRIGLNILKESRNILESIANNFWRFRIIRRAVQSWAPECVVSFIEETNIRVIFSLLGTRIPVVVSERIDPRRYYIGTMREIARRVLYPFAQRIVVQTDSVAGWAERFLPYERVAVIPNFIRDLPSPPPYMKRKRGEILAVGRLVPQKGFDLLLRAFAASKLYSHGMQLVILGDGPERALLQRLANELGIDKYLKMPGVVKHPERWMARCAFFVLPSRFEGFPNALLEAMAMGCPVIAADCDSGPREIVQDGVNGLLVPVEDVTALASAMQRLAFDKPLCERLGVAAQYVRVRYAKEKIVQRWHQLVEEVVQS